MKVDKVIDCESPFDEVTEIGTPITSPNYPSDYYALRDCQITIRFASDEIVSVTLQEFDVESHSTCKYDYLTAYDGRDINTWNQIGSKMCGSRPEGMIINSTRNIMTLHFHSDHTGSGSGFKAYANAIKGKLIFQYNQTIRKI